MLISFLQTIGFSCTCDDLLLEPEGEVPAQLAALAEVDRQFVHDFATKGETLQQLLRQPELSERHDRLAQSATSQVIAKVNEEILPTKLMRPFPSNNFLIMTQSGSKGSAVNLSWVATLIGQVSLESRRPRPLPMFERGDMSARAHGFVMSRFVTGLRPDEYFNASAGGREGLVDTAIKTAYGGYMQRSMTKHLEAVHVAYDGTVRSSDGQIIEFIYGEDGIDPAKSPYLRDFAFMRSNYDGYKQRSKPIADVGPPDDAITYLDENPLAERGETAQSKFSPITTIGAVSERFERAFLDYAEKNPETDSIRNDVPPLEKLRIVSMFNYFMSQIHCGEPVGICAAQAIGEPLTQMTMNTFHLAGYAGTNVTMGVPRLQELLIVASRKPRTPTMTIPFRTIEEAEAFARRFSRVPLRSLVEEFEYEELFDGGERRVSVDLRLNPERVDEMGGTIEWDSVQLRFSRALRRKITTVLAHEGGAKLTEIEEAQPRARNQPRDEDLGIIKRRERKEETHGFGEKPEGDSQSEDDELDLDAPGSELPEEDVPENLEMERFGNVIHVAFSVGNVKVRLLLDSLIELALDGVMVRETRGISRAVASPADKARLAVRDHRRRELLGGADAGGHRLPALRLQTRERGCESLRHRSRTQRHHPRGLQRVRHLRAPDRLATPPAHHRLHDAEWRVDRPQSPHDDHLPEPAPADVLRDVRHLPRRGRRIWRRRRAAIAVRRDFRRQRPALRHRRLRHSRGSVVNPGKVRFALDAELPPWSTSLALHSACARLSGPERESSEVKEMLIPSCFAAFRAPGRHRLWCPHHAKNRRCRRAPSTKSELERWRSLREAQLGTRGQHRASDFLLVCRGRIKDCGGRWRRDRETSPSVNKR